MPYYHISKTKVRPFFAIPQFLLRSIRELDEYCFAKTLMLHCKYMIQGLFWHIESNVIMSRSRAILKSLSSQKSNLQVLLLCSKINFPIFYG